MPPAPKQMYAGSPRPLSEVAVISEGARLWRHVYSIDDQYVVNPIVGGAPFTQGLLVLPGTRKVKVKYLSVDGFSGGVVTTTKAESEILVDAKAGHTYVLVGRRGQSDYLFWFEDKGTNYQQECLAPEPYAKKYIKGEDVPGC